MARITVRVRKRENVVFSDDFYPDNYYQLTSDVDSKRMWLSEENSRSVISFDEDYLEETPRKRVRIRIPILRKNGRHKLTVVRRRPITSKVEESPLTVTSHIPRRIVVTRVRTLGLANSIYSDLETDSFKPEIGKHKVTITRRRKIGSTTIMPTEKRTRITRRKLIAVRPIQPTPSFAIITTGFFTAPSSEYDEEYSEEDNDDEMENKEDITSTVTPELKELPNIIDSKPGEIEIESKTEEIEPKVVEESIMGSPIIITDNFFFPPSDDEDEDEYEEEYMDMTTEEENVNEEIPTMTKSTKDEDGNVSNRENTLTTFVTSNLSKKKEIALEKFEETSHNVANHEIRTISVNSKQEEKSEEVSTVKSTKDEEIITTTQESFEETLEENVPTTIYPEIKEDNKKEDEKEKDHTTTVQMIETTVPVEETTVITVPEEKTETIITFDRETTTIIEEEEKVNNTEHLISSTETSFQDSSSENKESQEKDIEFQVTTIAIDFEDTSSKNREDFLEKHLEFNTTLIETDPEKKSLSKNTEDSLKKDIESHVTVTQIESKNSSQIENYQKKDIETQITKVQIESETLKKPTEYLNKEIQSHSIDNHSTIINSTLTSKSETERSFPDTIDFILKQIPETTTKFEEKEDNLTVQPIEPIMEFTSSSTFFVDVSPSFASVLPLETSQLHDSNTLSYLDDSEIPSVIPLGVEYISGLKNTSVIFEATPSIESIVTTSISSPTPEEIEAGLADDLYLSLSRPDFLEILPSKPMHVKHETRSETSDLEPSTSIYYTETVVTSTRLRTYTYVVTQLNGLETKVTSSTTVRPRVTTLTLTVPVTVTVTPTVESSAYSVSSVYNPAPAAGEQEGKDEEGRRFNLATRIMSNGVEVIVAGPTPALRWENSIPQPTLTLSDAVVMMLPQDKPNEFVTKTCTTTFTYLTTITKDGTTIVSTEQQVIANTATEERHRKPGSETAAVTLEASPTLRTEVFKTTYTYLTLNTDHSDINDALESSTKVIANTVTAPQHYLDMILEPSEAPRPETNTYLSTRLLEKTFMEDGRTKIETTSDTITQLIVTESAPPPRPTSVTTTLTALDSTEENMTDVMKTYYITYTYYNTFLEKGSTVVRTNVATSTDVVLEKVPVKKTTKTTMVNPTPEPIQIFATKTYLTTFTYFTTLLQAGPDGETSTTVSSRSHIVENVVTESIAPSLLDAGYMNALLTTAHHSDPVKNVVTGSTIIFFDEEDQIDPTTSTNFPEVTSSVEVQKDEMISSSFVSEPSSVVNESNLKPIEQINQESNVTVSAESGQNKKPINQNTNDLQVSNLLSLGSLGINSLSALGPVITAMAGLLQGKTTATRRNDSIPQMETQEVTTQRSPIYIPVAEFADGDIEAAESQNIGTHLANLNHNYIAETRHKVASSLADGIPISPGEVITANSDVIIGKPGKMAPRPPQTFLKDEENIGMKPPPLPVPNIPVHPVLEVLENDQNDAQPQQNLQSHKGPQIKIYPAHQIYEEHLKIPISMPINTNPTLKQPQKLLPVQPTPPKKIGSKQDMLDNDPLLKPPDRPNVEQYANPNMNLKEPEWNPDKTRRPWSAKDPLKLPPSHPQFDQKIDLGKPSIDKLWPTVPSEEQKRPPWAQKDPLLPETPIIIQTSESKPTPAEPIVHQVPHVIDRSTGQPLLVNIQPSQVANVVIPQGGTQALIFGDTSEPHISGQYFDDPSPYPESEVGLGFLGIQRVEDLSQYNNGKDPADYMVPPSPPFNFKTLSEKHSSNRPATIPLSPAHFDYERPQDKLEISLVRPEKKPSDVHLIKHPDNSGVLGGQGHVHTEILVHHRPEIVNVRPQSIPHPAIHPHIHSNNHLPPRGQYPKIPKPISEPGTPPRRTEMSNPSDNSHRYILLAKPDSGNEIILNSNWKSDKKPPRILMNNRLRPRLPLRSTTIHPPLDRPIYPERPGIRKPVYSGSQRLPTKAQNTNTFVLPHRPITNLQIHHEPHKMTTSMPGELIRDVVTEKQPSFGTRPQTNLQNRPPHFYSEKKPTSIEQMKPQTERTEEYVPTGAVEYHNPLNLKIKQNDKPVISSIQTQNFNQASPNQDIKSESQETWYSGTQTEKTLDSESGASEPVKYHNQVKEIEKYDKTKDDTSLINDHSNDTSSNKNSYVASSNTMIGKVGEIDSQQNQKEKPIWINQGVPFAHKNEGISIQTQYGSNYYNTKPHEMPIVQGKPFGVYTGHEELNYGYKWKETSEYDIVQGVPSMYYGNKVMQINHKHEQTSTPPNHEHDDTIDLKPPAIIPQFVPELDKLNRPYPRPTIINKVETRPVLYSRPEIISQTSEVRPDHVNRPNENKLDISEQQFGNNSLSYSEKLNQSHFQLGGFMDLNWENEMKAGDKRQEILVNRSEIMKNHYRNNSIFHQMENQYSQTSINPVKLEKNHAVIIQQDYSSATKIHPEYPHIVTKPKPQVPSPITISTANNKSNTRPNIKFSLSVEAIGEEMDSKTQTERPPSMLITTNSSDKKKNIEKIDTSYQMNFATQDANKDDSVNHESKIRIRPIETSTGDMLTNMEGMNIPSRDMMPPPLRSVIGLNQSNKNEEEDLKPPPIPSRDVVGLSPPPVDITTTNLPMEDKFSFITANESGLKPPPKYIPLKESSVAPLPSISMVPPSPRPSLTRPFIVELLSQDMVPPPPVTQTTRPLEIATVRPAVAVSGSIQIATAVATSHIPVVQDIESKIPIIHGTVDLPVVIDVPEILRPIETRKTEHVSIYTVRPFDTRPVSRISLQSTAMLTTNLIIPTKLRPVQVDHIQPSRSSSTREVEPTRSHNIDIPQNPVKRPEHPVFLESSYDIVLPSSKVEATESLIYVISTSQKKESRPTMTKNEVSKVIVSPVTEIKRKNETVLKELPSMVTRVDSSITKVTNTLLENVDRRNVSMIKMTKSVSNIRKVANETTTTMYMKPKEVTRFQTSTITRTKTAVLGSPPTTRTLLLTHTLTSTTVETVTETLLRPTSVVSTVTSTILQSVVTRIPSSYENIVDNDSIFVVMSDQKPPAPGAEEVEAEYGDISRDEQDPAGNEVHRVLAGGILGAPIVSLQPIVNQCTPECKASRAEICTEVGTEMRCICRPGFARMFPDRPCKPTYTYTLRVGLDRIGHEPVIYEANMNNSTSTAFRKLLGPTKDALDRTLMQSDLRDIYRGLKIAGFTSDPTKVEFHVQLSDNANETRLKEVLRKYLIGSNYSLGGTEVFASKNLDIIEAIDFDECIAEDGGPHHDCSPNAACFNLRGSYQCSCKEGWADLSENPAYPGRFCSQAPLGCPNCNNKGHCVTNTNGQEVCECFPWHSGQRCQVNLKVLLIALVTTGAILLGLLAVCVGMACFRQPNRKRKTGDRRAMIPGTGGDTSSEGSVTDLAIPHHVPHILPPPPQMIAPLPPTKRPTRKISTKPRHLPRKATMIPASVPVNDEQRDRSLTVMIPRAKYRSAPQSPQNYKSGLSTFSTEEHKLLNYLENGTHNTGNRKQSVSSAKDCKEADVQIIRAPAAPTGALVSAGFQVSATVTRQMDTDSTLARSCGETTVETATKVLRTGDLQGDLCSTLARSCDETTIQAPTKLRLDLGEAGSTLARSCGETTIQPPTKVADTRRNSVKDARDNRDTRDSASEGHTMAERDLGSTLRLPAQHPPLYSPDRTSDRESNFDSL